MLKAYEALGWTPNGKVAVKLSTGELPSINYLRPELIRNVVEAVDGTIVECSMAYGGSRSETAMRTIRWPRITASPPSPIFRSWMRMTP